MTRPRDEIVVHVSATRHPIENLLVQFSVLSLVIMAILGIVISVILTTRLNRDFQILKALAVTAESADAASTGLSTSDLDRDLAFLRWTVYVAVGGGFVILYGGLVSIVWRGWRTIKSQQVDVLEANRDLRAAYNELRDAQEKLVRSERLAAIGELSAGVAHDLRNPLGAIKNAAYYIKGKVRGSELLAQNPRVGEFLDIMDEEVDSSNEIITDLMEFARVNPPSRFPTELESVVDNALDRAPMKESVEVVKDFDACLSQVSADREQLRRAFGNLLKNADDAMPKGGTMTITGRSVDDCAELRFIDTGVGITESDLHRVMEPLFTTKAKGIGLGLAIANMIIQRHDGTLAVASHTGEGTTFTIRLPLSTEEPPGKDSNHDT